MSAWLPVEFFESFFSFLKVGSSPKSTARSEETTSSPKSDGGSWRQAIFKRVVTPGKSQLEDFEEKGEPRKRSKEELRELWKKSIHQAVLLVRMEKENARIKGRHKL